MSGIYFDGERAALRSFSSASKGTRSVIRIEIETSDPHELGSILQQCASAQAAARPTPPAPRPTAKKKLAAPPLLIGYREDDL